MDKVSSYILITLVMFSIFSCEKVEIPNIPSEDAPTTKKEKTTDIENEDSILHPFKTGWIYNCTLDLENGEIKDSTNIKDSFYTSGAGTEDNPYTIYDFLLGNVASRIVAGEKNIQNIWITGFIVGYIQGKSINYAEFGTGNVVTNIIIGCAPDEVSAELCVPIQLPKGTHIDIRNSLNLVDNPFMLGHKVTILGDASVYMGTIGLKNPKKAKVD